MKNKLRWLVGLCGFCSIAAGQDCFQPSRQHEAAIPYGVWQWNVCSEEGYRRWRVAGSDPALAYCKPATYYSYPVIYYYRPLPVIYYYQEEFAPWYPGMRPR